MGTAARLLLAGSDDRYKELCDKYLISDRYFELIITAMHIRRYGYDYLPIKRTFN